MKILVIEDNHLKREKVVDFLKSEHGAEVFEAAAYNSGLTIASESHFDFIVLDMSMPTFDRTETDRGGRFRTLAGKEIATRLKKLNRLSPFAVLTGYTDFSDDTRNLSIDQIRDLLTVMGDYYKGTIFFDSANSKWKETLSEIIENL
ncbi:response regulator [Pseudomonas sp. Bout1]|uniref:response regulator n=1 Tax=Pseudomonas sp. Bout1 TaxID=3048600 RepID=UPI002AB594CD|nr:response regulator [Pseudomonas sp. Bout1]MDY7530355.1 response regulator [Pseudomonas sp. Bout1]MEB0188257.1 response regulator [Pseudomonas sp. Bout1]